MPGNWFCEVTKVIKSEKHPNADSLSIVTVFSDYKVVTRLDEFKEGDLVAYFAVDSILPETPEFSFLDSKTRKRLRAKRLRGVFSMGLVIKAPEGFNEGDSVEQHYGITRYIPLEERDGYKAHLKDGISVSGVNGLNEKNPIGWSIPYYDLEPLRKYGKNLIDGENVVIQEKINGQNFSCVYYEDKLWVKSRNNFKKYNVDSQWWVVPIRDGYEEKLKKYTGKVMIGELYGNVGGYRYDCNIINKIAERKFRIFDIYDLETMSYLDYDAVLKIAEQISIPTCPEIYRGPWASNESLYEMAEGDSLLGNSKKEGFVIRSLDNMFDNKNNRKIYKLISQQYLLEK